MESDYFYFFIKQQTNIMGNFRALRVWQKSKELAVEIYRLTANEQFRKDFGLRDQIRRAAVSIPSNIAEGDELDTNKQSIRHFHISKGSTAESITQLIIAFEINYISQGEMNNFLSAYEHVSIMLRKLISARTKPSNHHAIIPSYHHTIIPSYHHTIIPSYHHTIIPSYHHTTTPPHHHTIIPSYHHTIIPSNHHTIKPSYHHTIIPSNHHTIIPSNRHTIKPPNRHTMRAAIYHSFQEPLSLENLPVPEAGEGAVVIKVEATGLCRSDWHGWMGHDSDICLPQVPGHEFAGVVEAVGKGVRHWKSGDRVTVPFSVGCGNCPQCLSGNQQICDHYFQPGFTAWGSFAEFVMIKYADHNLVRLPDSMEFTTAAVLGCRFVTSFRAVAVQGGVKGGDWVAIHGCGGVGLSAIMIATAFGAKVIALDIDDKKLAFAKSIGASVCLDAREIDSIPEAIA